MKIYIYYFNIVSVILQEVNEIFLKSPTSLERRPAD